MFSQRTELAQESGRFLTLTTRSPSALTLRVTPFSGQWGCLGSECNIEALNTGKQKGKEKI